MKFSILFLDKAHIEMELTKHAIVLAKVCLVKRVVMFYPHFGLY